MPRPRTRGVQPRQHAGPLVAITGRYRRNHQLRRDHHPGELHVLHIAHAAKEQLGRLVPAVAALGLGEVLRGVTLAQHVGHGNERLVLTLVLLEGLPARVTKQHRVTRPRAVAVQLDAILDEQLEILACALQQHERHALVGKALEPTEQPPLVIDDQRRGLRRYRHRVEETDPRVMLGTAAEGCLDGRRVGLDQRVEHAVHGRPCAQ